MYWAVLILGNLFGGVLSAFAWRDRENVLLRFIALAVPVGCGFLFWYLRIKSGFLTEQLGMFSQYLNGSTNELYTKIAEIAITSILFTVSSKLIGLIIVKFIDR